MDDKWKNYQAPVAKGDITVNIDQWMKERQAGPSGLVYPTNVLPQVQLPAEAATPEEQEAVRKTQQEVKDRWIATQELVVREGQLTDEAKECVECGETRQQYHDDYVCYRCRDDMEG